MLQLGVGNDAQQVLLDGVDIDMLIGALDYSSPNNITNAREQLMTSEIHSLLSAETDLHGGSKFIELRRCEIDLIEKATTQLVSDLELGLVTQFGDHQTQAERAARFRDNLDIFVSQIGIEPQRHEHVRPVDLSIVSFPAPTTNETDR